MEINTSHEYKYNEYDKYDIIDFLETDYFDYLNNIPKEIWTKYKNDISTSLLTIKDHHVINFVCNKINIDYKFIIKNFDKINLELLKYLMNDDNTKNNLKIKIPNQIDKIFLQIYQFQDLEFNKFIFENFCQISNNNINNDNKNFNYKKCIEQKIVSWILPKYYNVLDYYIKKFDLIESIKKYTDVVKIEIFLEFYDKYKIDSYDKLIEFKNLLQIDNITFASKILFKGNNYQWYQPVNIISKICNSGDIDYLINVVNNFNIHKTSFSENIISTMFTNGILSGNVNFPMILYNYLKYNIGINFNKQLLSKILFSFISTVGTNHKQYEDIIYQFIDLGGVIKGYSVYTDYIESINFLQKT